LALRDWDILGAKTFAIPQVLTQSFAMTKPAALLFHDDLLAGSQLFNRLQDLGYRVQGLSALSSLVSEAVRIKPIVFVALVSSASSPVSAGIEDLRKNPETAHIPVLLFTKDRGREVAEASRQAGATLVAGEAGILTQLRQLMDQVLQVE